MYLEIWICIFPYTQTYTHIYVTTIKEKGGHKFGREKGGIHRGGV